MEKEVQKNQLERIRHFLKMEYYDSAVKECCGIMEEILKNVYRQALSELPVSERAALMEAENAIGRGTKGYTEFGFGQLVALFNKSRLLEAWAKHTGKKLGIIKSISLDYIVEMRNQLTHSGSAVSCSRSEANLVYDCLMSWLAFIGYNELSHGVEKSFEKEPDGEAPSAPPVREPDSGKASYRRHADYLKQKTESSYRADDRRESRRLKIQSQFSETSDAQSFEYALKSIGPKPHLFGLDVGCADGFVTESRFKEEYGFEMVVGIDYNQKIMESMTDHGIFRYRYVNVESPDFEDRMEDLLDELGIDGFDVIFMALALHHLKQPERFLRKIRRFLNKNGAIILRGVDDGALLSYGDDGLVEKIIEESIAIKNISDRFHARKFHSMLRDAGFTNIKMNYSVDDTVGLDAEEKEVLFQYYFKFRSDYTRRQLATDPENPIYQEKHEQLVEDLENLQDIFMKPDFYFMVMTITAIAIK